MIKLSAGKTDSGPMRYPPGNPSAGIEPGPVNRCCLKNYREIRIAKDRIFMVWNGGEIHLPRGREVPDPKRREELINMLDRSLGAATMGALLSLRNDDCEVLVCIRTK